jgi:hypothetical protein
MTAQISEGLPLSVVVPLFNEQESVRPLIEAVRAALGPSNDWELVLVDDGSRDDTSSIATECAASDARVRLIPLARNYGQTQAIQAGFDSARGDVIVSMDGDLQNDPADIPRLVEKLSEGYDLVAGYRLRRQDTLLTRRVPSWVANRLIAWLTGVQIRDTGCSLKAYRSTMLHQLSLYSDMHRFLPALVAAVGGARIAEIPVQHHPRRFGTSKYGLSRIGKVLADLLTIKMISSFRERPLMMFGGGAVAALTVAGGFGIAALQSMLSPAYSVDQAYVFPGSALLCLALSSYLVLLGLIGEITVRREHMANESRPFAAGPSVVPVRNRSTAPYSQRTSGAVQSLSTVRGNL